MKSYLTHAVLAGTCAVLVSCSAKPTEEVKTDVFSISDTLMNRIKIDTVKNSVVKSELRLTGKIVPDENNIVKVFPLVGGYVADVKVQLGDHVEKGQALAVIRSGEVADYERELIDAQSNLLIAQKNQSIAEDMFASKLYSEKELIIAKKEVEKAQAELNRVKEIYDIYNIDKHSDYIIKSPISGFIVEKKITRDIQIRSDQSDNIFTISQMNQAYVMSKVYETDLSKVKEGYDAFVTTIAYPDQVFTGKVCNVYNTIDPTTKTMSARIKLDYNNDNYQLKPEMFASVTLHYNEDLTMTSVPASAVIFDKSKNFIMVYTDRSHIDTREVEVYKIIGDIAYIKSGLKEGERVLTKYQLYIYDALND